MKKQLFTLGLAAVFGWFQASAQTVDQNANWPNTAWSVSGTFSAADLLSDPTTDPNLSYDDDNAGSGSTDSLSVVSPIIDLTPAFSASENYIFVDYEYDYNVGDLFELQYWDADASDWVTWEGLPDNSISTGGWCANLNGTVTTSQYIDISAFTANQLTNFQYRFVYDASDLQGWGFCMASPRIYSQSCLPITGLTAGNESSTSVELTWTAGGSETAWNIEYGTSGFTQGSGTVIASATPIETVTGLSSNTTYDFYVQADCGGGDESAWVGPVSATTLCGTYTAPWTEDFENAGSIPDCWAQGASNAKDWEFANTGGFDHIGSDGTINGTTNSNGYFAWLDDSSPHETGTALLSPMIDATPLTSPMLQFYRLSDNEGNTNVDFSIDVWDGSAWNTGVYTSNTNSANEAWELIQVSLTGLTITGDIQIRFIVDENNGTDFYDDVAIDDVSVIETPTCPMPSDLNVVSVTSTDVEINWTAGGTETAWNIEHGATGFTQGSGTFVPVTSTTETISGLSPNTTYDFYVQADCGGGDESMWIGPITATTNCATVSAPWSENFDGVTWTAGTGFSNTGDAIDPCWSRNVSSGYFWGARSGATGSTTTGPDDDFTGGANYVFTEGSNGTTGDLAEIISPQIDLSSLTLPELRFNYHMYGDDISALNVEVSDDGGSTWTSVTTISGEQQTDETDPWLEQSVILVNYIGQTVQVKFSANKGGTYCDIAVDQVSIDEAPSCPEPIELAVANITSSDAELSWTVGYQETEWIIEYDTTGFTLGTGMTMVTTNNPETISGLMDNTTYDAYVRAICGPNDTSAYTSPITFTTECNTFMAPFIESFDNGVQPDCWENLSNIVSSDEDAYWEFDGSAGNGAANNGRPNGTYAWSDGSTPNPDSVMLITPNIDLSPLTEPYLEFDWFSNNEDFPGDNIPLIVDVLVDGTWSNIDTLATDSTDWMTVSYNIDTLAGEVVKFRFMTNQTLTTNSAFYNDILLDDVRVDNCNPVEGQDGSIDFCRLEDTLNLNDNIIVQGQSNGRWAFPTDSDLIVNDTMLVVTTLPAASYEAYYIVDGICADDTTVATINVFPASTAGSNGSLTVCLNEPINLFDGLIGTVDLGGTWYDPSNNPLPNSQPTASNIPGNYNFDYITSNGVCPADTALVEVVVDGGCDWLSIGEEEMNEISVYPNPATNVINVVNPANTSALKVEIVDVNGRIVVSDNKALENSTEGSIAIDHLETGIYTLRIYGENGQKTFKIVKK